MAATTEITIKVADMPEVVQAFEKAERTIEELTRERDELRRRLTGRT